MLALMSSSVFHERIYPLLSVSVALKRGEWFFTVQFPQIRFGHTLLDVWAFFAYLFFNIRRWNEMHRVLRVCK